MDRITALCATFVYPEISVVSLAKVLGIIQNSNLIEIVSQINHD
ncbi:hypothetical protein [Nostoc sp. LEGE 06077]|nr:hypothetical protein [Nostoc sp. LEGE 06077]